MDGKQPMQRGQVPIDTEADSDPDAIEPIGAPPPYSQHESPAERSRKPSNEGSRVELVDLRATVNALPQIPLVGQAGTSGTPSARTVVATEIVTPTPSLTPDPPTVPGTSDTTASVTVPQIQSHSHNSRSNTSLESFDSIEDGAGPMKSGLSLGRVGRIYRRPAWMMREIFGCNLCFVVVGVIIGVAIVLGASLGVALGRKKDHGGVWGGGDPFGRTYPFNERNYTFNPILVKTRRSCLSSEAHLPEMVGSEKVLWTCDMPDNFLNIELRSYQEAEHNKTNGQVLHFPTTLPPRTRLKDETGLYNLSPLLQYVTYRPLKRELYEGVQPLNFHQIPLDILDFDRPMEFVNGSYLYLGPEENKLNNVTNATRTTSIFEFSYLYTREVVLRTQTVQNLLQVENMNSTVADVWTGNLSLANSNNYRLRDNETVWLCKWDLTYLKGQLWMEDKRVQKVVTMSTSTGFERNQTLIESYMYLNLTEKRPTEDTFKRLFGELKAPAEYTKGGITCRQEIHTAGELKLKVRGQSAKLVEKVESAVFKRFVGQFEKRQGTEEGGECSCNWGASYYVGTQ